MAELPIRLIEGNAAHLFGHVHLASRELRRDALANLITAHAIALDVTLATNNPEHLAAFPGLRINNWLAEA